MCKKKVIVFFLLLVQFSYSQDAPSVKCNAGVIRGHNKISSNGKKYLAFEGIPYALPPVGKMRFMPPEQMKPTQGEILADKFRNVCIGFNNIIRLPGQNNYVTGVEDCLYLNVYIPAEKTNASLPVIFYIYGGALQFAMLEGSEQTYLMDNDIIFVSFNYRHGLFGFLSTGDGVVTGNMGLKDQAMALNWVSQNIKYFGGDPKNIMLLGFSAGTMSVHYHYLSEMSKGLFRSGISMSGTALHRWAQAKDSRNKAIRLGQLMNCSTTDMIAMIECLQTRPAQSLAETQAYYTPWYLHESVPFGPVVEKNSPNPFISRSPIDIINSGDAYDVPWITGSVSEEGLFHLSSFYGNKTALENFNQNWDTIAPYMLEYNYTIPKEEHIAVAQKIRKHYFDSDPISQDTFSKLVHVFGDTYFTVDAQKAAVAQAKVNRSPVWFYSYSYRAGRSLSDVLTGTTVNLGVCHCDDVFLVSKISLINPIKTPEDSSMRDKCASYWLSVARKGKPDFGPSWSPINSNKPSLNYLHMMNPNNFKEETNDNLAEKKFWETIYSNLNLN